MIKSICAGSFDPISIGHLDIIERAARLSDSLDVAITVNKSKKNLFTEDERADMVKAAVSHIPNIKVVTVDELLVDFILKGGYNFYYRGLRNEGDFQYEIQLAQLYRNFLKEKTELVYLMTAPEYSYISSSIIRENYLLGADISTWVPKKVYELMYGKYMKV